MNPSDIEKRFGNKAKLFDFIDEGEVVIARPRGFLGPVFGDCRTIALELGGDWGELENGTKAFVIPLFEEPEPTGPIPIVRVDTSAHTPVQSNVPTSNIPKIEPNIAPQSTVIPSALTPLGLDMLARRIVELKLNYERNESKNLLQYKWLVGKEICHTRVTEDESSYRQLETKTKINYEELRRCAQFYQKFVNENYPLKAWRRIIAELPEHKEESKPIDQTTEPAEEITILEPAEEVQVEHCPVCGQVVSQGFNAKLWEDKPSLVEAIQRCRPVLIG